MKPDRMNAFTDGVIAIIITIMVLEMRVPEGSSLAALRPIMPIVGAYVLSFIYVGIYWNNHHHMMQSAKRVDGRDCIFPARTRADRRGRGGLCHCAGGRLKS